MVRAAIRRDRGLLNDDGLGASARPKYPGVQQPTQPPAALEAHPLAQGELSGPERSALAAGMPKRGCGGALVPARSRRSYCLPGVWLDAVLESGDTRQLSLRWAQSLTNSGLNHLRSRPEWASALVAPRPRLRSRLGPPISA